MLAALRTAVAAVSSELAEKNAVARVLAQHGHRRPPSVIQHRDANGVTRVYLWDDAGIALVTGPSLQGTVYEVHAVPADADPTSFDVFIPAARGRSAFAAGRKAKALANPAPARAPLARAPRRIGATPITPPPTRQPAALARHNPPARPLLSNPPKGPPASIPGPEAFLPAADDEYGYAILAKMVGPNKVYSIPNAVLAATMRRVVKDLGLADTVTVEKGQGGIYDVRFNAKQGTFAPDAAKALKSVMSASIYSTYGTMGFYKPLEFDPYADYSGPVATFFYAPYVNYIEALLFGALGANDIATLPAYMPPALNAVPGAAGAKGSKGKSSGVAITFQPGVGLTASGDTYAVKGIIKDAGFMWTGKEGKYGYPLNVWAAANSDAATSGASLVGWSGKQKTVMQTIASLKAALEAEGVSVTVDAPGMAAAPASVVAAASGDPNPPPSSPIESIAVPFGAALEPYAPNPVWADGGGVDAIAARLVHHAAKPGGGLSGEVLRDTKTGKLYLAKYPPNPDMVASEVVAAHLYRAFGAPAPDMRPAKVNGKTAILSPWIDGLKPVASSASGWNAAAPALEKKYLGSTFPLDVWLADYDVVGLTYDNMLWVPPDPHIIRVDPGASLMFRASGALKHPLPGVDAAPDLDSMLFVPKNDKTPVVFAAAKDDPSLLLPVANALVLPAVKPFMDALAGWAGYTLTTGIPVAMTLGGYLAARAQSLRTAVLAKAGMSAATTSAPAASAPTAASSSVGVVENIAKKIAALLPGTTASGTSVGPWTVVASPGNGVMVEAKGGVLTALIMAGGEPKQKLEYPIPSGSITSFVVSRAADIANAFKPYLTAAAPAPQTTLSAPSTSAAGLTDVSLTEIDALPEGSVVTGAASPGETFFVRDASGLWRELTEHGDFMPGLFSDDVYDTLGGEVLLVNEGSGTGPEADDAIMLSAYYVAALDTLEGKAKGKAPAPAAAKPAAPPAPAVAPVAPAPAAAAAFHGDPNPWPTTGFATDLGPDPGWDYVGGSLALATRLATASFGPKLGSFPGGKVTDPLTGQAFYVKFFKNVEHGCTEALASRLYRALGVNAPDVRWAPASAFGSKGSGYKVALISPWKGGYIQRTNGNFDPAEREFLRREFPADVWMANYDVVGKGPATKYDNLLVTDDFGDKHPRHYLRVDQGAALDYRSTGSEKKSTHDWGTNAAQTWGSFLSSQHPTIFKVFDGATPTMGAVMIQRIGALVGTPAFDATLAFAGRKADLGNTLKGRAGFLAGMLQSDAPAAAPVAAPAPAPAAAPAASPSTQVKQIAEQARQIIAAKGFNAQHVVALITLFDVTLYEGSEAHSFPVKFSMQGEKVSVRLGSEAVGLFSPSKAGAADAIATAILAVLRLKMANLGLTKAPPGETPGGAATTGSSYASGDILTTALQIANLPLGSVIAYGQKTTSIKGHVTFFLRVPDGKWQILQLNGETKGEPFTVAEMLDEEDEWGAVVIRVGTSADLAVFFGGVLNVTGKDPASPFATFPIGA